jgi:hypothetical protein
MTQTIADREPRPAIQKSQFLSLALATSFILIAAGVTRNDISYVFLAPIFLLAMPLARSRYSNPRKAMILLAMGLTVFGTVKGYFVGHDPNYILRFTAPLLTFALVCLFPGIGEVLYRRRFFVLILSFLFTFFVFFIVKTGDFYFAERFFPGWTLTFSSNAAVSVWHYFTFLFCILCFDYVRDRKFDVAGLVYIALSILTIILLFLLTDTSAYGLAIVMVLLLVFVSGEMLRVARLIALLVVPVVILDFLTVKVIWQAIVNFMYGLAIEDVGDMLRLIQIDYFVRYAEFFGSGFGAEHAFPLESQFDRQVSQIVYPYASELPILNILYNGGILAGIWFFWLSVIMIDLAKARSSRMTICTFGLGGSAVMFGSISNPYLFAPTSMLLLAIMFDIWDQTRAGVSGRPRTPRRRWLIAR